MEGWPLQFVPVAKLVEMEALEQAEEIDLEDPEYPGLSACVPSAEHLMAIAIDLLRPKDKIRLEQFHQEKAYDPVKLAEILERHHLLAKGTKILDSFGSIGEYPQESQ